MVCNKFNLPLLDFLILIFLIPKLNLGVSDHDITDYITYFSITGK